MENQFKEIIKDMKECSDKNKYAMYLTDKENVIFATRDLPLLELRPKTSRELLKQMCYILENYYNENQNDFYYSNDSILPIYYNDKIEDYHTQLILGIFVDEHIYGTLVVCSFEKVKYEDVYNNVNYIKNRIVKYFCKKIDEEENKIEGKINNLFSQINIDYVNKLIEENHEILNSKEYIELSSRLRNNLETLEERLNKDKENNSLYDQIIKDFYEYSDYMQVISYWLGVEFSKNSELLKRSD